MATDDLIRARLDGMVSLRHPLAVLDSRMPWAQIEAVLAPAFAHKDHKGRTVESADMFGPTFLALQSAVAEDHGLPMVVSIHPCTQKQVNATSAKFDPLVRLMKPLGFLIRNVPQHARL
jgi:hypothetical protein